MKPSWVLAYHLHASLSVHCARHTEEVASVPACLTDQSHKDISDKTHSSHTRLGVCRRDDTANI